jgi:hypothetical protein
LEWELLLELSLVRWDTEQQSRNIAQSAGDTTITRNFLAEMDNGEEEDDGDQTETGADTDTDAHTDDYHGARQSIVMSIPSGAGSCEDLHSVLTMTDNDYSDSEDDGETIKASRISGRATGSFYIHVQPPLSPPRPTTMFLQELSYETRWKGKFLPPRWIKHASLSS